MYLAVGSDIACKFVLMTGRKIIAETEIAKVRENMAMRGKVRAKIQVMEKSKYQHFATSIKRKRKLKPLTDGSPPIADLRPAN